MSSRGWEAAKLWGTESALMVEDFRNYVWAAGQTGTAGPGH